MGSTCSFVVSRTLLSNFVNRLVANDKRYEALSLVLKHDGLKLLVMIRLCPLPYSISNGAISTFPTVQPLMFAAATAAATPKLLIAIFIGSRLAVIAKSGEKMDTTTKAINWASIIFGVILGVLTGWIIYKRSILKSRLRLLSDARRTLARSRQVETEERSKFQQPATTSGDDFSDNLEDQPATLVRDDQIDFLGPDGGSEGYRDDFDVDDFRYGDDEEGAIGLDKQPPQR